MPDSDATARAAAPLPGLGDSAALAMLRQVVATARAVAHVDAVAILLHDREQGRFVPATPRVGVGLDERWQQNQGLEAAQTLAWRAAQIGDVLDIADTATTADLGYPLLADGRYPGAVSAAPLLVDGSIVGVLELYAAAPRTAPLDPEMLRSFATLVGVAINTAWGHERERTMHTRLEVLYAATQVVAAELSLDRVLERIVEAAATVVGARYGALGVVGADGYLSNFITTGLTPEEQARLGPLPRGHGLLGVLIRQGQPLRVPDMSKDPRHAGFPPHHPPMRSLLGVPIRAHSAVVGDLYLTDKIGALAFSEDDQHLVELLAVHAGIAIENARLHAQLRQITTLQERDRIARDLHDGIIQDIYAATLQLENLAEDTADASAREHLLALTDQLSAVIEDIRTYIMGLQARELAARPLPDALAALLDTVAERGGLTGHWHLDGVAYPLPETSNSALLQVTREALSNVVRHARASSATVRLAYGGTGITLTIGDDGQGFDLQARHGEEHHGLRNIRARTEEAGGTLDVRSEPGAGTQLRVWIPATP